MPTRADGDAEKRITRLHRVAAELQAASDADTVYDTIIETAVEILGFDWCSVATPEDSHFVLRRVSEASPLDEGIRTLRLDEGVAGRTFQQDETVIFQSADHEDAKPIHDSFNSGLSVPLGKWGIFQGVAADSGAFDERDREAAELLASHATAALERIEHEEVLKEKNERLEKFASVISHDLRNPLNVAELRLNLVQHECDSEHLDDIEQALDRMEELIDDLLVLARVGEGIRDFEPVDLSTLIEACWETVDFEGSTLAVETDLTLMANPSRLKQLLENLFSNAVEHGGEAVTVRVGNLEDGFYVEDTGVGIDLDERERIFEPGYSTGDDGTGFGLSIVADIVEAHDWEIVVTESTDGGARFEITAVTLVD